MRTRARGAAILGIVALGLAIGACGAAVREPDPGPGQCKRTQENCGNGICCDLGWACSVGGEPAGCEFVGNYGPQYLTAHAPDGGARPEGGAR